MSDNDHDNWLKTGTAKGRELMSVFDIDGQLVVGEVEDSINLCSEGGGGAVVNPATKQVADIPVYLCAVLPGGNVSSINKAYVNGHNGSAWYAELDMRGSASSSAGSPTAVSPSQGAWWLLLLFFASVARLN